MDAPVTRLEFAGLAKEVSAQGQRLGVVESKLDVVMKEFDDPSAHKEFLFMDGERVEAGLAFSEIYARAKKSIILIDDYIGARTLHLLKTCRKSISITILSDNAAKPPLEPNDFTVFASDTGITITLKPTMGKVHDRYIVIDYKSPEEAIFHCGASSKDAGNKMTTIIQAEQPSLYHPFIDALL